MYMGGCQNYGPFLDPYYNTAPNIWGTQKRTMILATHLGLGLRVGRLGWRDLGLWAAGLGTGMSCNLPLTYPHRIPIYPKG